MTKNPRILLCSLLTVALLGAASAATAVALNETGGSQVHASGGAPYFRVSDATPRPGAEFRFKVVQPVETLPLNTVALQRRYADGWRTVKLKRHVERSRVRFTVRQRGSQSVDYRAKVRGEVIATTKTITVVSGTAKRSGRLSLQGRDLCKMTAKRASVPVGRSAVFRVKCPRRITSLTLYIAGKGYIDFDRSLGYKKVLPPKRLATVGAEEFSTEGRVTFVAVAQYRGNGQRLSNRVNVTYYR